MALPSNLKDVLFSLECYTDEEKKMIEEEFNHPNVSPNAYILADLNIIASRLKKEGKIQSEIPSYEYLCEIAKNNINEQIFHTSDDSLIDPEINLMAHGEANDVFPNASELNHDKRSGRHNEYTYIRKRKKTLLGFIYKSMRRMGLLPKK